ncbi:MAG: hypothetical protein KatS3mg034_1981 [Vicingaceae bacterium]|nr:MAG: hypothetical protein KatS3mg034_1981 [Vicingaceae bacterium]
MIMRVFKLIILTPCLILCMHNRICSQSTHHWETAVYAYDYWKYLVPSANVDPDWDTLGFNDSSWNTGKGGFGYGDNDDSTIVPNGTWSVYTRIIFNVPDTSKITKAVLSVDFDDAFVAYINGVEVARSNIGMPQVPPNYNQPAGGLHEAQMYQGGLPDNYIIPKTDLSGFLKNGNNVLAISYHNESNTSSDLSGIAYLHFGISDNSQFFGPTPSWFIPPVSLDSFNLPLLIINTNNQNIVQYTTITADMGVIDNYPFYNHPNDPFNNYNGKIGIRIRGSSSASMFPKKGYKIETRNLLGNPIDVHLLGFPAESDWILHNPYSDKTLMRNALIYRLMNKMGRYATRTRFCELFINGEYMGVYVFEEKIKRDKNRVDIAKLLPQDTTGNELTGGYILKIDKFTGNSYPGWTSNYTAPPGNGIIKFQYHDPEEPELHPLQKQYIQEYVDSFETALAGPNFSHPQLGFRKYADEFSFIDFFIANEITKNVDGYRLSTFFYKDRNSNDPRIHMGPIWDFNLGFGNANYCAGGDTTEWAYLFNYICGSQIPFWWERLMQDTIFVNNLKCRWLELRNSVLHTDSVLGLIDSAINVLGPAIEREFYRWPRLGTYVWPNNYVGQTYQDEINYLKNWIIKRLTWIDMHLPGECHLPGDLTSSEKYIPQDNDFYLFPNPCRNYLNIMLPANGQYHLKILSISGQMIKEIQLNYGQALIDLSSVPSGVYFITYQNLNNPAIFGNFKFVKIE